MQKEWPAVKIYGTTNKKIQKLYKERRLSEYTLIYQAVMPPSAVRSILHGESTDPGIANIKKITEGLSVTIREFYNSEIFDDLEQGG